ncbi:MAG: hypothetical protein GY869_02695 [Planctomycetes bacterium]|nr:hypothetical protein [Planctomycetota bacterium]
MKISKSNVMIIVLILTVLLSNSEAQQEKTTERNLEFKLSSIPMSEKQYGRLFLDDPDHPKTMSYVAEVIIPEYPTKELERIDF